MICKTTKRHCFAENLLRAPQAAGVIARPLAKVVSNLIAHWGMKGGKWIRFLLRMLMVKRS